MRGKKVNIEEYLTNLEPFLKVGCSLHEACIHGEIPYTTMVDYYNNDESIRRKIDTWGNWDILIARQSVVDGMKEDSKLALDYLKHKKSNEFNTKNDTSIQFLDKNGQPADASIEIKFIETDKS